MAAAGIVTWSKEEEKAFENAIAMHWIEEESNEQWEKIASMVPSKSVEELKQHYQLLVEDVDAIEAGQVPLPSYTGEDPTSSAKDFHGFSGTSSSDKRSNSGYGNGFSGLNHDSNGHGGKGSSRSDQERRKGIPWTEEEHRDRRRSSIHDITSVNNGETSHQAPITGQHTSTNPSGAAAMGPSVKHRAQPHMPGLGMYGAPVGRPVAAPGHMASAVGTPVMLPPGHHPPPPYIVPVAYPMAPPPMHQ
ncbi:hypothetical protein CCACVL1_06939 [Corchorus capsularis]|uniref:Uncharacterized protein n=1 Tax=Corchorus capsularis TaxID=210143 RepID=A0A1R3JB00_COCAP|nr:hypothetical protein CCACVL1_06939 [Corchorus capsularis]